MKTASATKTASKKTSKISAKSSASTSRTAAHSASEKAVNTTTAIERATSTPGTSALPLKAAKPSKKRVPAEIVKGLSKIQIVLEALRAPKGATMDQLTKLTGWQQHSVRGAISGILKRRVGLHVRCFKAPGAASIYTVDTPATAISKAPPVASRRRRPSLAESKPAAVRTQV